jgi:signal transduction histidine kinase
VPARTRSSAAGVTQAGLPVTVTVTGPPGPLPAVTDLAAFRIIQEALTNCVRHAGPATATVAVRYDDDCLRIEVTDDGGGARVRSGKNGAAGPDGSPGADGSGHGLRGMRERAAAAGGSVEIGPAPAGGFRVAARFPRAAR